MPLQARQSSWPFHDLTLARKARVGEGGVASVGNRPHELARLAAANMAVDGRGDQAKVVDDDETLRRENIGPAE